MQGPTHRRGGEFAALLGTTIMTSKGVSIEGVHPLVQFAVIYPFAMYGSKWSDLDHHKGSIPFRDAVSMLTWRILHLTSGIRKNMNKGDLWYKPLGVLDSKHRSWQTHSDFTLVLFLGLTIWLTGTANSGLTNQETVIRLIGTGFSLGIVAHLILDMITPEGCHSVPLLFLKEWVGVKGIPTKFSFVPKSHFFATGGKWETFINRLLTISCYVLLAWMLIQVFWGNPIEVIIEPIIESIKDTFSR